MTVVVHRHRAPYALALVDEDMVEWASSRRWNFDLGYAVNQDGAMHRQIMGLAKGEPRFVHHINEDRLDNRRENLRVCNSMRECSSQPHPRTTALGSLPVARRLP